MNVSLLTPPKPKNAARPRPLLLQLQQAFSWPDLHAGSEIRIIAAALTAQRQKTQSWNKMSEQNTKVSNYKISATFCFGGLGARAIPSKVSTGFSE